MRKNNSKINNSSSETTSNTANATSCHLICPQNGLMEFDIFLFSTSYQEKLPIIYANIRV